MLNHSCVPCRARKLKCDGGSPCSNCLRKGIDRDCLRAQRKARPRKEPKRDSIGAASQSHGAAGSTTSSPVTGAYFPSQAIAVDPNIASNAQQDTLLRLAREALGDASTCAILIKHVFFWRVQSLTHACIDVAAVLRNVDLIFQDSPIVNIPSDNIVICMMTVALALQYLPKDGSIRMDKLTPIDGTLGHRFRQKLLWELSANFARHQMSQGEHSLAHLQSLILLLIYDQMSNVFRDQIFDHAVRSAKRLGLNSSGNSPSLTDVTTTRTGEKTLKQFEKENEGEKEEEMKARTWWYLVTRSWFMALSTSSYSIHPIHFSTRLPRQNRSLDMYPTTAEEGSEKRALAERLLAAYSPLGFSLSLIALAELIRSLVDQRLIQGGDKNFGRIVQTSFEAYWNKLPYRYSVSALEPEPTGEDVVDRISKRSKMERWVLHQLFFHAYLELYQFQPTEPIPEASIALANHILNIQCQVDSFCPILNSLRVNIKNVVKASSILVMDLMQNPKTSTISRSIVLSRIQVALSICRKMFIAREKDFELITEMLRAEEEAHGNLSGQKEDHQAEAQAQRQEDQSDMAAAREAARSSNNFIDMAFSNDSSTSGTGSTPHLSTASHSDTPITDPASSVAAATVPDGSGSTNDENFFVWSNFYPSEAGLYPVFQSDTVGDEWANVFESFLASSGEPIAAGAG